jgi:Tol biopolymer transport system component
LDLVVWESTRHPLRLVRLADEAAFDVTDGQTMVWSPNWSPDGRHLYFVSDRGGTMDLRQQSISEEGEPKGEAMPVTTGLGIMNAAFSSDGAKLAYSKGEIVANLWRVPILDGRPATWADAEQLTFDQALVEFAGVSPDGSRLLFDSDQTGNADLWMMDLETREIQQWTINPAPEWKPAWSPDGSKIAFYRHQGGNRDIWVMPVPEGQSIQLTSHEAEDYVPAWSPDGSHIAFVSSRTGMQQIWLIPADGGSPKLVEVPENAGMIHWSADGNWLAFDSEPFTQLWRVPAQGGETEPLTKGPGRTPSFSRDGTEVYFIGTEERAGNIWSVSLESGEERAITEFNGRRGSLGPLCLTTDGQYIYFAWRDDLGNIWVADVIYE